MVDDMPKKILDPLPSAAFQILLSLVDGDLHGYGMMRQVAEQTSGRMRLGPGTLYSSIQALLEAGCIEEVHPQSQLQDHSQDRSQKQSPKNQSQERRRFYRLTAAGRTRVREEAERLEELLRVVRSKGFLEGEYV
jgi:DNA-binding PadR family transcriptional regulator